MGAISIGRRMIFYVITVTVFPCQFSNSTGYFSFTINIIFICKCYNLVRFDDQVGWIIANIGLFLNVWYWSSTFFIFRSTIVFICFERSCCFILVIYIMSVFTVVLRILWDDVLNGRRFYWLYSTNTCLFIFCALMKK